MNSKEITEISPFFQLPNYESKQELIFFKKVFLSSVSSEINFLFRLAIILRLFFI